jgi:multiple sugar transport system substrate-binding protein
MRSILKTATVASAALVVAGLLAACSGSTDDPSAGGKTAISVVSLKPGSEQAAFDAFENQVRQFEAANPDIDVTSQEYEWTGPTFTAQLAGGTLPTVFTVPFTDGNALIERGQLADLTQYVQGFGYADKFNETVLRSGQSADGGIFGVPTAAYGVGLHYNRTLFTQAGLDPDKPPTTWDEVRQYAKQISEKTGKAGYAQLTTNNTGGWMLTTMTYSMGGTVESADGKKSTFNDAPTKKALQLLKDMRWTDNSMGSRFLYNQEEVRQDFAAGKIGMVLQAPDAYDMSVKQFGMKPADFGEGALPQDGGPYGTLTGGSLKMISPKATKNEVVAALKWIKFDQFDKYTTESVAVQDAKTTIADKGFVGRPGISPLSQATYDQFNKWREPYVNVPVKQFQGYIDSTTSLKLLPEPSNKGQEVYSLLDPVVQQVLTKKDADIDKLLSDTASKIDARLAR